MRKTEVLLPESLFSDIDRDSPIPLYFQVSKKFETAIRSGTLPPGSRIENEISLSERLGLSRPTIRRAIQSLVDAGLVVRRRGVGSQVVHGTVTRGLELTSLFDDLAAGGGKPKTKVLRHEIEPASPLVAQELGVAVGSPVLSITRLRSADGVPVAILQNWLSAELSDLTAKELERTGLYQALRQRGYQPQIGKQKIGARKATSFESDSLDIERGSALLTMDRTAYDSLGRVMESGHHCYRPDLYSLEFTVVSK